MNKKKAEMQAKANELNFALDELHQLLKDYGQKTEKSNFLMDSLKDIENKIRFEMSELVRANKDS